MDVWNGQIMDVGLTVTGYLAASGLGMLLHSVVVGRRRLTAAETHPAGRSGQTDQRAPAPQVQFIDLRAQSGAGLPRTTPASAAGRDGRRDRVEIIRLARQMLSAGTPADRVRRTLPISEAELTLLQSIEAN
mgnify:CR=1 FL=1